LKDFGFLLEDFSEDYNFCMVKYLSFHNSSSDDTPPCSLEL